MKFVIIGLGNFGSSLGAHLAEAGHEVIGTDCRADRVEQYKDTITFAIQADTADELSIQRLPIADADYVLVCIGEDVGASVTTIALLKKHYTTKIIARAINPIHATIIQAMGVEEILNPEAAYAQQLVNRFELKGSLLNVPLDKAYEIVELNAPSSMVGQTLLDLDLRNRFRVNVITVLRRTQTRTILGKNSYVRASIGVPMPDTLIEPADVVVLFGATKDLKKLIEQ